MFDFIIITKFITSVFFINYIIYKLLSNIYIYIYIYILTLFTKTHYPAIKNNNNKKSFPLIFFFFRVFLLLLFFLISF